MEQYLLKDKKHGYYWICFRGEEGKFELNGPHSFKPINLEAIVVENPIAFNIKKNKEEK